MGNWGEKTLLIGVITPFITSRGPILWKSKTSKTKQRMIFRMVHIKDSRSYEWAKFGRLGLPGLFQNLFTGTYPTYLPTRAVNKTLVICYIEEIIPMQLYRDYNQLL